MQFTRIAAWDFSLIDRRDMTVNAARRQRQQAISTPSGKACIAVEIVRPSISPAERLIRWI